MSCSVVRRRLSRGWIFASVTAWPALGANQVPPSGPSFVSPDVSLAAEEAGGISVLHAWARATPANATNGAAYVTVNDHGAPDHLTGVSTPVAKTAELHQSHSENGVMKMRSVTAIPLEPGKPLTLAPGGYHVMLLGLQHPLQAGESFPMTLTFEHAAPLTVSVTVEGPGQGMHGGTDHQHMDEMR